MREERLNAARTGGPHLCEREFTLMPAEGEGWRERGFTLMLPTMLWMSAGEAPLAIFCFACHFDAQSGE